MGFFSRVFGGKATTTATAVWLEGDNIVAVVGEASYQPAISRLCGSTKWEDVRHGCVAALVPEPSNVHDKNAVMVQVDGELVGYLSRGDAMDYAPAIRRFAADGKLIACEALVAGRGPGSDTKNLGVFLHLPDADEALRDAEGA